MIARKNINGSPLDGLPQRVIVLLRSQRGANLGLGASGTHGIVGESKIMRTCLGIDSLPLLPGSLYGRNASRGADMGYV